jgi:hypothetical protein
MILYWKINTFPPNAYMILSPDGARWAVVDGFGNIMPVDELLVFQYYREDGEII